MTWPAALVLFGLVLAVWLARLCMQRPASSENASRPRDLGNAELVYMEEEFRIGEPIRLVAKVDRVYRRPNGLLVLVELKTRSRDRVYASDVIQLSAQKLAIERQTGDTVEPVAFVTVLQSAPRRRWKSHRVRLLDEGQVIALERRRKEILTLQAAPAYAASARACSGCAFRAKCDRLDGCG